MNGEATAQEHLNLAEKNLRQALAKLVQENQLGDAAEILGLIHSLQALAKNNSSSVVDGLTTDERHLLESEGRLSAVKAIRARTGLRLKESVDTVDAYLAQHPEIVVK